MSSLTLEQLRADNATLRCALDQRTAELLAADKLLRTLSPEAYKLRERLDQLEQIARELAVELRLKGGKPEQWLQQLEEAGK